MLFGHRLEVPQTVEYLRTDRVRVYSALPDLLGWQPSRFPTDRAEAERASQLAEQLGSINAAATELGTREFRGSVERANGFRQLVEQAGGRVREMVWTMGEYDFITVFEAPDDETAAALVLRVAAAGNVHTQTMRAFDADQMSDIITRTG